MDIGTWLKELGLAEYAEAFAANGIDSAMLAELTNDDLKDYPEYHKVATTLAGLDMVLTPGFRLIIR